MTTNAMNEVGGLTWDAVQLRLDAGALAILPIGAGAKQHGWHLPMRTDQVQAEWLAARLAEMFDGLIWPTLTYGHYPAFASYAGSASLSAGLFEALVLELAASLLAYAPRLIIVNSGISTIAPVDKAIASLTDPRRVLHLRIYDGGRYRATAARLSTQGHGGHADEMETSRMLALAPDAVSMAKAKASPIDPPGPGPMQRLDPDLPNYSASGVIGDPAGATCDKGHALLTSMLQDLTDAVEAWVATGGGETRRSRKS